VLRAIWSLSARDNPYADWILIRVTQRLVEIRAQMSRTIEAREAELERLRATGVSSLSVLASTLAGDGGAGFPQPYGYATAEAIVEFDYHVRLVQTLMLKDRLSDEAGREAIRRDRPGSSHPVPGAHPLVAALMREDMLPLSRADFPPGAERRHAMRVQAAVSLFGEVPRAVFTGGRGAATHPAPRHPDGGGTPAAARSIAEPQWPNRRCRPKGNCCEGRPESERDERPAARCGAVADAVRDRP